MNNLQIYENFKKVPAEAKKPITGGRLKGFTDINPMWRIKKLTEQFGVAGIGWYTEILTREIVNGENNEKAAFIGLKLYVKIDGEWSKPIYGEGGSMFVTKEKAGHYTSDEAFKMAYTDALSICCKSLGMAADVYFEKDRTKYDAPNIENTNANNTPKQSINPEPPKIDFDEKKVADDLSRITTKSEMSKYWNDNKDLQSIPKFKKMITEWSKKLT